MVAFNPEAVRERIREAIVVSEFYAAPARPGADASGHREPVPMVELIIDAEQRLGVPFPPWLREIYESCNGFATHTGDPVLYRLQGDEGVTELNLFLREEPWHPSWISRAIVFGHVDGSLSTTTHTVALDGVLVEWCYGDGEEVRRISADLFAVWQRMQARWDAALAEEAG